MQLNSLTLADLCGGNDVTVSNFYTMTPVNQN